MGEHNKTQKKKSSPEQRTIPYWEKGSWVEGTRRKTYRVTTRKRKQKKHQWQRHGGQGGVFSSPLKQEPSFWGGHFCEKKGWETRKRKELKQREWLTR